MRSTFRMGLGLFALTLLGSSIGIFSTISNPSENSSFGGPVLDRVELSPELVEALPSLSPAALRSEREPETVNRYEQTVEELQKRAIRPEILWLHNDVTDPLERLPVGERLPEKLGKDLSQELLDDLDQLDRKRRFLVQFDRPITPKLRETIEEQGVDITSFIPNNALLLSVDENDLDRLENLPAVRFMMRFDTSFRIDSKLAAALRGERSLPDEVVLQVSTFFDDDPTQWTELFKKLNVAEIMTLTREGIPEAKLRIRRDELFRTVGALMKLEGVRWIRLFDLPGLMNSGSTWLLQSGTAELKMTPLFDVGLTGTGQIYASADSGLDTDACQFRFSADAAAQTTANSTNPPQSLITHRDNKVLSYYVLPGADAYDCSAAYYHGTMTSGCAVGDNYEHLATAENPGLDSNDGMAPGAQMIFQDVGNASGELYGLYYVNQYALNQQAYGSGARVHNDSYGLRDISNNYDTDSQALDYFMWMFSDYVIFFSAGNSGPNERTLGGEGSTAKSTLSVGASLPGWMDDGEDLISFSSRGPTTDGRLKPDIVTPGIVYSAVEPEGVLENGSTVSQTVPPNNNCRTSITFGTSFSSPTAAGMGLLVRQYFIDGFYPEGEADPENSLLPTGALVKAVILNSGRSMDGGVMGFTRHGLEEISFLDPLPSTHQGWGRMALDDALYFMGDKRDLEVLANIVTGDEEDSLRTGDIAEYELYVKDDDSFKVTLVWSDVPGEIYSGKALVNDLDLEVIAPGGERYFGNHAFIEGFNQPVDETQYQQDPGEVLDSLNSVENVFVLHPAAGTWTIRVHGRNIPGSDSNYSSYDSTYQAYSLIATGNIGQEPETLLPRVRVRELWIQGGCDDDQGLDRNEQVSGHLYVSNGGDGTASNCYATVEIDESSDVSSEFVEFPSGTRLEFDTLPPRSAVKDTLRIKVSSSEEIAYGKVLRLLVRVYDSSNALLHEKIIDKYLQADFNEIDEPVMETTDVCIVSPQVSSISPNCLEPGQELTYLGILGAKMSGTMTVEFEPDSISYDRLSVSSPSESNLFGVVVDENAEEGEVSVVLSNGEDKTSTYSDKLRISNDCSVVQGDEDDPIPGDSDFIESSDSTDSEVVIGATGGSGCHQTSFGSVPTVAFLLGILFFIARKRRIGHPDGKES